MDRRSSARTSRCRRLWDVRTEAPGCDVDADDDARTDSVSWCSSSSCRH